MPHRPDSDYGETVWLHIGSLWNSDKSNYVMNGTLEVGALLNAAIAAAAAGQTTIKILIFENDRKKGQSQNVPQFRIRTPMPKKEV